MKNRDDSIGNRTRDFTACSAVPQPNPPPPSLWRLDTIPSYGRASRSYSLDTPHSLGILWTSDQPVAETSTWQHTTLTINRIYASGGIRTHSPSKRAAADPLFRPRGHWDRQIITHYKSITYTGSFKKVWTISSREPEEIVQIFLKDPVYIYIYKYIYI